METLIYVIVPVYNVDKYLRQCIDSVINQTYNNLKIILVDDGSTDSSGLICEKYASDDDRIIVIHQKNSGLSEARNAGIDHITDLANSTIMFLDSDDFLELDAIEQMKEVMDKTDSDIVKGESFTLNEKEGVFAYYGDLSKQGEVTFYTPSEAIKKLPVMVHGLLYRGTIFESLRYPEGRLHEDNWTTPRTYSLANKVAYLHKNVYCYRLRTDSIMATSPSLKKMEDAYYAIKSQLMDWYFAGVPTLALERDLYSITANYIAIIETQYRFHLPNLYYELLYTNKAVKASIDRQEIKQKVE